MSSDTKGSSRVGRPLKPGRPGEKDTLSIRTTAELKDALAIAARGTGRSLSQEAEHRLECSFRDGRLLEEALTLAYGAQTAALLLLIAQLIRSVGPNNIFASSPSPDGWLHNSAHYEVVCRAVAQLLERGRPPGGGSHPGGDAGAGFVDPSSGELYVIATLDALLGPQVEMGVDVPAGDFIRAHLGPFLDRLEESVSGEIIPGGSSS
ncbi:MAG TPA: hypothetical protein VKS60_21925 [Stellaceae bacterium]|nr:hypothetical protein [Stellaceae bacterium]